MPIFFKDKVTTWNCIYNNNNNYIDYIAKWHKFMSFKWLISTLQMCFTLQFYAFNGKYCKHNKNIQNATARCVYIHMYMCACAYYTRWFILKRRRFNKKKQTPNSLCNCLIFIWNKICFSRKTEIKSNKNTDNKKADKKHTEQQKCKRKYMCGYFNSSFKRI